MTSKLKFSRFLRLFCNAKKGKFFTWKMLYVCLDKNICCPFLVEQNRSRLESVRKSRSPVPLLPATRKLLVQQKDPPDWRLRCAPSVPVKHCDPSDKQPPEPALTHKRCGPDRHSSLLPLQHTRSIPGISPFTGWKRATISPPLEWGRRPAGGNSFKTLPDLGFDGKSGRARWPPRAGSPSGSGRSPRPCVFDGSCFQYEALLLKHFILCLHECVFATENA